MNTDCEIIAKAFLAELSNTERAKLYNDLLALKEVHRLNKQRVYYTFKNVRYIAKRHCERWKRSFRYVNEQRSELLIHQIHEQHFFKNVYRLQIVIDGQEYDDQLLTQFIKALTSEEATENVSYHQHVTI